MAAIVVLLVPLPQPLLFYKVYVYFYYMTGLLLLQLLQEVCMHANLVLPVLSSKALSLSTPDRTLSSTSLVPASLSHPGFCLLQLLHTSLLFLLSMCLVFSSHSLSLIRLLPLFLPAVDSSSFQSSDLRCYDFRLSTFLSLFFFFSFLTLDVERLLTA